MYCVVATEQTKAHEHPPAVLRRLRSTCTPCIDKLEIEVINRSNTLAYFWSSESLRSLNILKEKCADISVSSFHRSGCKTEYHLFGRPRFVLWTELVNSATARDTGRSEVVKQVLDGRHAGTEGRMSGRCILSQMSGERAGRRGTRNRESRAGLDYLLLYY